LGARVGTFSDSHYPTSTLCWDLLFKIMAKREPLSKRIRFEVFKRDNFTCQYCGAKAPEVILEVDHIKPVKDNGTNEIMNLITSCFECNRGKSSKKISDNSMIEKQRKQIEELNIKRQQLEMMLEWKEGLNDLSDYEVDSVLQYFENLTNKKHSIKDCKKPEVKSWIKKYSYDAIIESIDIAFDKYYDGSLVSAEDVFCKIGAILHVKSMPEHKQKIAYIKGICKNKFSDYDSQAASIELLSLYNGGVDLDIVKEKIINDNFLSFRQFIYQSKVQNIWH